MKNSEIKEAIVLARTSVSTSDKALVALYDLVDAWWHAKCNNARGCDDGIDYHSKYCDRRITENALADVL